MPSEKKIPNVVQQDIALDVYLSTLLEEIPNDSELEKVEQQASKKTLEQQKPSETVKKQQHSAVNKKTTKTLVRQTKESSVASKTVNPLSVMPAWTGHEFQALFFKVDTVILAAPLTELLRTIKVEKEPTKIPGQPSWFLGLLDEHENRIGVVDTGQLIFGKTRGQQRNLQTQPFKRILITHDGKWGLSCDEIISIGKLEPEKVRWRTLRKNRPWLVGTVIEELTAVIDVDQLVPHRKHNS